MSGPHHALKLIVSYDGTDFAGSQIQPGERTVQAELERAMAPVFGAAPPLRFAGRTDRGVHAVGQVVSCADDRPDLSAEILRRAINDRLPADLAVEQVSRQAPIFHARYDATWREYRYWVWCGARQPLVRRQVWHRQSQLDVGAMAEAAARLQGEHDFGSFAGGGEGVPWSERQQRPRGTVRRMEHSGCRVITPWWGPPPDAGRLIEIRTVASGYLPQMVRTMVGVLVEIGRGAKPVDWIDELLAGRDRRLAARTVPPQGLILWRVGYGGDVADPDPIRNDIE